VAQAIEVREIGKQSLIWRLARISHTIHGTTCA
jgi:hypothetical protein